MFGKNLRYYRLKRGLSQTELAARVGIRSAAISNYEKGKRLPDMAMIEKLAEVLEVRVADFLNKWNDNLYIENEAFRENSKLSRKTRELVVEETEAYFSRFFEIVEILGGDVLAKGPQIRKLKPTGKAEMDAKNLRAYLGFPDRGPVRNLIGHLEDHGILFLYVDLEDPDFSGMSGTVDGFPYLAVNRRMTSVEIRKTIVHELSRLFFDWPDDVGGKDPEKKFKEISEVFLFSKEDAVRELGIRRTAITSDMVKVCRKYEIGMDFLMDRAWQCGIIGEAQKTGFHAAYSGADLEESSFEREEPTLFEQLVLRAAAEEEISVQKGAELLQEDDGWVRKNSAPLESAIQVR